MSSDQAIFVAQSGVKLLEMTIGTCLEMTCRNHGLREAVVFPDEDLQLPFVQLRNEVERLASGFLGVGLKPGDVVVLWGGNHANLILSVFACAKAGLIFSTMSHALTAEQLDRNLRLIEAKCLICFPSIKNGHCYDLVSQIMPDIENGAKGYLENKRFPLLSHVIIAEDDKKYKGTFTLSEVFGVGMKQKMTDKLTEIAKQLTPHDLACVQFTAGTNADPKPVSLSHYQVINSCLIIGKRLRLDKMDTILCCPMPVFRSPVLVLTAMATAVLGTKTVYPAPLALAPIIFQTIEKQNAEAQFGNAENKYFDVFLIDLSSEDFSHNAMKIFYTVCLGGDHVPGELVKSIETLTEIEEIVPGVFLTEAGCIPIVFPEKGDAEKLVKTQGRVADHFQLKIVDFNGDTAKFGQPGEISIKLIGGSKFLGYYKDSKTTAKFYDDDDWLRTGEVGVLDKDGYVSLMGQTNDVIFCKKKPVFPSIIEKHLLTHPWVIGVQIVGVPDKSSGGEKICACVVKKDTDKVDEERLKTDLIMMCKEEKLPEPEHVLFMQDFPRTLAKKVQKYKLKELAATLISA